MLLIADTSLLINFLNIDRMYLIGKHDPKCAITAHVLEEVDDAKQRAALGRAIEDGHVSLIDVTDDAEVELFAHLQRDGRLGSGECSAIAVALRRGYSLGIDDKRAAREARARAASESIAIDVYDTGDIMARLILAGHVTLAHADVLIVEWRSQHRFELGIKSFEELLTKS